MEKELDTIAALALDVIMGSVMITTINRGKVFYQTMKGIGPFREPERQHVQFRQGRQTGLQAQGSTTKAQGIY